MIMLNIQQSLFKFNNKDSRLVLFQHSPEKVKKRCIQEGLEMKHWHEVVSRYNVFIVDFKHFLSISRGGSRTAATSTVELFVIIVMITILSQSAPSCMWQQSKIRFWVFLSAVYYEQTPAGYLVDLLRSVGVLSKKKIWKQNPCR